jgi:phospholipid-binding lipoprotein MlaA
MINAVVRIAALGWLLMTLCACVTTKVAPELTLDDRSFRTQVSHAPSPEEITYATEDSYIGVDDPLHKFNRTMYAFNSRFDTYVFLPAVSVYEAVLIPPLRKGISNSIDNLNEVPNFVNSVLQAKPERAFKVLGRFLVNSTLGVLGLFDVATEMGIDRRKEDFGQTLGVWGVDDGPYLVLPVLGPSNVRDTAGLVGDYFITYYEMEAIYDVADVEDRDTARNVNTGVRALNARSTTPFRYYSTDTPFEYEFVRFLYTKKRELDVER